MLTCCVLTCRTCCNHAGWRCAPATYLVSTCMATRCRDWCGTCPDLLSASQMPHWCVSREPRLLACLREISEAFGTLPSAGALVLMSCWMDLHTRLQAARGVSTAAAKHLDGAVIITGGLGALGALASAWLCGTSSQSDLWLLGRSGRASESHAGMPRPRQHGCQSLVCRSGFPFLPCRWRDAGTTGPQRAAGHLCQGRRVGSRGSCTRSDLGWVGFSTLARHIACWWRAGQQSRDQCQCYNHPDRICRCVLPPTLI